MKRFFQTLKRDGSFKKLATSRPSGDDDLCPSVASVSDIPSQASPEKIGPLKFMSWNANSLILRFKNNLEEISGFVQRVDADVIAIQEVRIPAAGRKGEPRNKGEMKDDTTAAREDKEIMTRIISQPPFASYKVWWSLADTKYAGTALFVKQCFNPLKITFSLDQSGTQKHDTDGRVILAEFNEFNFLNTYVPNNGWKEEELSFHRRRKWDQRILDFVSKPSEKPLIWCGDLNVSHEDIDVSHPDYFRNAKLQGYVPPQLEDYGQPGFTLAERQRFGNILKAGDLIDSYRWLHQQQDRDGGYSWSGQPIGMYRGKRMRIDYFLISRQLVHRLIKSNIHGHGIEMEGFYGSDHCPITMELSSCE